jgi:hypothetical protein
MISTKTRHFVDGTNKISLPFSNKAVFMDGRIKKLPSGNPKGSIKYIR